MNHHKTRLFTRSQGLKVTFILFLILLTLFVVTDTKATNLFVNYENNTSPLGTNLSRISDYSSDIVFLDAFKSSRPWITRHHATWTWDTGEEEFLDLDDHGWVRSLPGPGSNLNFDSAATLLLYAMDGHYPGGQYVVLYDGEGTIEYGHDAVKNQALSSPGRDVLDVTPSSQGIFLVITSTDPNGNGNYIRNIRVIMPGYENTYQTEIFNPSFINIISKFRSIRFMDWMDTNETTQSNWADRPLLVDARWSIREGVPVEMMVNLANHVSADPWFTLPHTADDNYISQFAALVRDNLDANLKVYVEYSNEVWNGIFPQSGWVEQQALAEWPGGSESPYTKRLNWYGKRTAEMCDIWENVWGAQSDRVVCVMGAQAASTWTADTALNCSLWEEAPCQAHNIDAVAIAPYFAGYIGLSTHEAVVQNWNLDQLFTEIFSGGQLSGGPTGGALQQAIGWMENYGVLADQRGIDLIGYEGGQHLVGVGNTVNNTAITNLFHDANRDPRMGTAYEQYLAAWKNSGGRLFAHFNNSGMYTKWGAWGSMEFLDESNTPKYSALMNFIDNNPCWWTNCELAPQDVPILNTPSGTITNGYATFEWAEGGDASQYQLVVNDTAGEIFSQWYDTSAICNQGTCSVSPTLFLTNGDYTWTARGMYGGVEGPWATKIDFTVELPIPTPSSLSNPSFEVNVPAYWREGDYLDASDGPDCGTGNINSGDCALVFNGNGTNKRVFSLNPYNASAGDEFTLSLYRKGADVPSEAHTYANIILFYTDGTKEAFNLWLHQGNLSVWEQRSITITAAKDVKRYNLNIFYKKASGSIWVDDISVTHNGGANMVTDPSFESWKPNEWMLSENFTPDDGPACTPAEVYSGACSLRFVGDGTSKRLLMRVMEAGSAGDVLNFSVFRKGEDLPIGAAYANVILVHTDGTLDHNIFWLHQGDWSTWEQRLLEITAEKDYKWINLNLFYKKDTGTIWLDDISLSLP